MNYFRELRKEFSGISGETDDDRRPLLLDVAKDFFGKRKDEIYQMHLKGAGGAAIVARYTALVDSLVRAIYSLAAENKNSLSPHALLALGGYGRRELCFCSDLDIMFLHERRLSKDLEALNDYVLYFLWDMGFKVGHSIRSIRETLRFARLDDSFEEWQ